MNFLSCIYSSVDGPHILSNHIHKTKIYLYIGSIYSIIHNKNLLCVIEIANPNIQFGTIVTRIFVIIQLYIYNYRTIHFSI